MIRAEIRLTNDSIAFIEKTYRKKDPGYADYSVQQQQRLLERLNEEWTTSECTEPLLAQEKKRRVPPPTKDSTTARRGSKKCEMILAEIRAANDSIAFIEKTYGKKNPEYADFSIQQQQHLLRGLNEEWAKSQCNESPRSAEKK